MTRCRTLSVALAVALVVAAFAPVGAAVAEPDDDDLSLVVSDDGVVAVTANDTAVENATVEVTADDDSYAGTGNYTTDADGEVELPTPEGSVTVTVTASTSADAVSVSVTLEPADEDDAVEKLSIDVTQGGDATVAVTDGDDDPVENATVNVTTADENASYVGTGEYATDENGTVPLEAPTESVNVTITASVGGVSAETTVTLEPADDEGDRTPTNFGSLVSAFVQSLDSDGPPGRSVAQFVLANNPGNPPDHAGPPDDDERGPPDHAGQSDVDGESTNGTSQGPPDHAGQDGESANETQRGPPDHAGQGDDDDRNGGPPDHAGPSNDDRGNPPGQAGR